MPQLFGLNQQIHFCASRDGTRIAYATTGEGPPLVKAANWLTHVELDWGSPVWRHLLVELARHHTLVRYDERGCGLSDREAADISFEAFVQDLEAVVDALRLERFVLLGISQGGAIAVAYAVRHPERVSHLVLYGAYPRGRRVRARSPGEREEAETMVKLVELGWGREDSAFRQFFTAQFIPDGTLEQQRWFNELERRSAAPEAATRIMRVFHEIDVTALAPRITRPTLVLHSDGDARVPFDEGRLFASLIPGARFAPLPSRNHILLEAEPAWREFVAELRAFLPRPAGARTEGFGELSARESEVLELIAQGLDNAQIAARLGLSEKTVRNHITAVFSKIQVETRAQAIVHARDAGYGKASG
jgi:pimeloyl-ACP methyl ester carboxylesterase/DNA-binding CsgD family transcriptional regulator